MRHIERNVFKPQPPEAYGISVADFSPQALLVIDGLRMTYQGVPDASSVEKLYGRPAFVISDDLQIIDSAGTEASAMRVERDGRYRKIVISGDMPQSVSLYRHTMPDKTVVYYRNVPYGKGGLDGRESIQLALVPLPDSSWDTIVGLLGGNSLISGNRRRGGIFRDFRTAKYRTFVDTVVLSEYHT